MLVGTLRARKLRKARVGSQPYMIAFAALPTAST